MIRLRLHSKGPLAVGGILAVPLFFAALLAFSLRVDAPTRGLTEAGALKLFAPTKGTIGEIYALALALAVGVVLVGVLAATARLRLGTALPATAAIVASIVLQIPLAGWAAGHTARYAFGTDNIRDYKPQNLMNQGEWEQNAQTTVHQVAWVTIGLAIGAIVLTVALEIRRRRGAPGLLLQPDEIDAELDTGGAPLITGG